MPDLSQSLQGRDLGHLRIVAELWGVDLSAPDARVAMQRLAAALLDGQLLTEVYEALPGEARQAVEDLLQNEGRLPWQLFTRRYGAVRDMGPARRDRDRPHANPSSPAEMLWYRALVGRAFFDTPDGPVEFAFIPEDLLPLIPAPGRQAPAPLGRPATPAERAHPRPANDRILDHACTLLAALRLGLSPDTIDLIAAGWITSPPYPIAPAPLLSLLTAASLLDATGMPSPEPARAFLEAPRAEALSKLVSAWMSSPTFDELRLIPHLKTEGEWTNDPLRTRKNLLGYLSTLPEGEWWSLPAFVDSILQAHPDFQRPAGDYDSWFIRDRRASGQGDFLRGFEHWDEVDGELIRYMICGPLHWLGVFDLAFSVKGPPTTARATAFRFTRWARPLLQGHVPDGFPLEEAHIVAASDARLRIPRLARRAARYLIARFCAWDGESEDLYYYHVTPASLARARQQGLKAANLLSLMRRYAPAVPPSLVKSLERWEQYGCEARFEKVVVLRLTSPELLQAVRGSRAARFLGDPLGPTSVIVKPGAWQKVLSILAEMGYLGEANFDL